MTDTMTEAPLADFADAPGSALPDVRETGGTARPEDTQHALSDATAQGPESGQQRTSAVTDIEAIAITARAAWRSAEEIQQATRDENRACFANFKKIANHHADTLKQLQARFEQSEQKTQDLLLQANQLIAEHQAMADRFNKITRRIALSAFATVLILLVILEVSWWVS